MPDPYELLGLPEDATPEDAKKAWRRLAREHHPDLNPDDPDAAERFKAIQEAYESVRDGKAPRIRMRRGPAPNPDWVDALAWMAEHHVRVVKKQLLPRWAAEHGVDHELVWAVSDAIRRGGLAREGPLATPRRLRRALAKIDVAVDDRPSRTGLGVEEHNGRWLVVLYARELWRRGLHDEDLLRPVVFHAVELGVSVALPRALGLRRGANSHTHARELDLAARRARRIDWGFKGLVVGLVAVMFAWTAWNRLAGG